MDHEPVLISTIAIGLTAAFIGGLIARRHPPARHRGLHRRRRRDRAVHPRVHRRHGYRPRARRARRHPADVRRRHPVLDPRAAGRALDRRPGRDRPDDRVAGCSGSWLGSALGWSIGGGLVLGLAISIASTVVLLRALTDRHELETPQGRIAVGWLIVEDLLAVLVLVLLPTIAPILGTAGTASRLPSARTSWLPIAVALAKAVAFAVVMIVVGARVVPWLLHHRGARGVARAVHAGGPGHRARDRLRRLVACSACRWRSGRSSPGSS